MIKHFIVLFIFLPYVFIAQERFLENTFDTINKETYEYSVKDGASLKFDFYHPENDTSQMRPLLVFMHGGGFAIGKRDDEEIIKLAENFARKGYVVASISYRLSRKDKGFNCDTSVEDKMEAFRLAGEDLLDAICFLIDRKEKFRINPEKIIMGGSSAGAETILMATYDKDIFFKTSEKYKNIKPAAIISLAGALTNIELITSKNAYPGIFFHGTEDPLVPYETAPHHYCDKNKAGYLILHGSKTLADKLKELNSDYLLYTITGGKHDIFEITPEKFSAIVDFLFTVVIKEKTYQKHLVK